jgi:hypothetical protein
VKILVWGVEGSRKGDEQQRTSSLGFGELPRQIDRAWSSERVLYRYEQGRKLATRPMERAEGSDEVFGFGC